MNPTESQRISNDDTFTLVDEFYRENGHLRHQIEAFNNFIHHTIRNVFDCYRHNVFYHPKHAQTGNTKKYIVEFENYVLEAPKLPPTMTLLANGTYGANLYVDVRITPPVGESVFRPKTFLGVIPVMVRSDLCKLSLVGNDRIALAAMNECVYDTGGYFVAKVVSKDKSAKGGISHRMIVMPQERATPNRIFIFRDKKTNPKYSVYSEIRSTSANGYQSLFLAGYINDVITCVFPRFLSVTPIFIVFGALGITNSRDVLKTIACTDDFSSEVLLILQRSLERSYNFDTQERCLEYIGIHGRDSLKSRQKKRKVEEDEEEDKVEDVPEIDCVEATLAAVDKIDDPRLKKEDRERRISIEFAREFLRRELFSHLHAGIDGDATPIEEIFALKAKYLGIVVNEILRVIQSDIDAEKKDTSRPQILPSDRDHLAFKRTMDINILLEQQLRGAMMKLIQEIRKATDVALQNDSGSDIYSSIRPNTITNAMVGAISSSNAWHRGTAKGVSQIFDQFNYAGGEANKRKTKVPTAAEGTKMTAPHDLHASQYGVVCPSETPDGGDTGLTKNLAMMANLSLGLSSGANIGIQHLLLTSGFFIRPTRLITRGERWVLMNGDLIGIATHPEEMVRYFRTRRRSGDISREAGISMTLNRSIIRINTDQGRLMYPAMIIDEQTHELKITAEIIRQIISQGKRTSDGEVWTWERLCSSGYIELIDKDEEDNILLASYPSDVYQKADEYLKTIRSIIDPEHTLPSDVAKRVESKFPTHCEIHPSMMYGIGASLIPFPDHNQSPRNCYQSNMSKQFIGVPFTNFRNMLSGKFHVLEYLQIPLTLSRAGAMIGYNNLPTGQNAMIAIMPAPYNEEDSLMMSRDAKERGFMASTLVVNHFVECHSQERFMKPVNPDITKGDFSKLGDDGIVPKGTCVKSGDVLICKIATDPQNASQHELFVTVYKDTFPAVVDKIVYGKTVEGFNFIRMMVVQRREPVIGDKFAARHSQKGTIGMIVPQIDLPFSERDGTSPDIVVNALAFPSRMTIAMLIELMTGRVAITKTQHPSVLDVATVEDLDGVLKGATLNLEKEIETKFNKCLYDDMFGTAAQVDATAFRSFDLGVLIKELERCGITDMCSDRMYNGITGKLMNALVFRGPVYYGRMKHMVQDKMHARQRGGKSSITHQPLEGRRSGGGMRNGVQERDNFLGVGAPHVAQDRLFKQSDDHTLWVCDFCGLQASVKFVNGQLLEKRCNVCSTNQVSKVSIPFGTNLVFNELAGMGIFPRIITRGNSRALP